MPPSGKKVPVTVLTGFLGSGKTTLLNHILSVRHGLKFAIIENEFGEVGVDEHVIKEDSEEQIIEVMNGCICCTVRGDLVKVLKRLRDRLDTFDGVIIETTGMADPAPVAQTFFVDPEIQKDYHLDSIVTVVDSKHVLQHLTEEKPEGVENESVEQIAFADKIILNKTDLVDDAQLAEVVAEVKKINSSAEMIKAQHSQVDPAKLLGINAFSLDRVLEMDPEFMDTEGEHQHDNSISSISWKFEGEVNVNKLERWIREMLRTKATDMFRYKGMLAVKGMEAKYLFQGVHMLFNGGFEGGYKWKEGEKRECRFVFIGRNLDKNLLEKKFMDCKVTSEVRFKVGDRVEANVSGGSTGWMKGTILAIWDDGNPYRIRLDDGDEVWGPDDSDEFVRSVPSGAPAPRPVTYAAPAQAYGAAPAPAYRTPATSSVTYAAPAPGAAAPYAAANMPAYRAPVAGPVSYAAPVPGNAALCGAAPATAYRAPVASPVAYAAPAPGTAAPYGAPVAYRAPATSPVGYAAPAPGATAPYGAPGPVRQMVAGGYR